MRKVILMMLLAVTSSSAMAEIPSNQAALLRGFDEACRSYDAQPNEIRKSEVFRGTTNLYSVFGEVKEWVGTLKSISTSQGGAVALLIIKIGTSDVSDIVRSGSSVYNSAADMREGQEVIFSGQNLRDHNLTERGKVCTPNFKISLTLLRPVTDEMKQKWKQKQEFKLRQEQKKAFEQELKEYNQMLKQKNEQKHEYEQKVMREAPKKPYVISSQDPIRSTAIEAKTKPNLVRLRADISSPCIAIGLDKATIVFSISDLEHLVNAAPSSWTTEPERLASINGRYAKEILSSTSGAFDSHSCLISSGGRSIPLIVHMLEEGKVAVLNNIKGVLVPEIRVEGNKDSLSGSIEFFFPESNEAFFTHILYMASPIPQEVRHK